MRRIILAFYLILCIQAWGEHGLAQDGGGREADPAMDPRLIPQGQQEIPVETMPGAQPQGDLQNLPPQDAEQQSQGQYQGQAYPGQVPYSEQDQIQGQGQTRGQPQNNQGQQNPGSIQGQPGQVLRQGQGQVPMQGQENLIPLPDGQQQQPDQGQRQQPGQGQRSDQVPSAGQLQPQTQDQLPPGPPQGQPLPRKPKVFPKPRPTPTSTFTPAPPPPAPLPKPEPTTRPQPSGPKTAEQRAYESTMQARWKAAADEIALLKERGETLQGKKGKAFRESLRTASGNRSMAKTKLNQLVRGSSADFDKFKKGVERAFTDLDNSIVRMRSYFDERPSP